MHGARVADDTLNPTEGNHFPANNLGRRSVPSVLSRDWSDGKFVCAPASADELGVDGYIFEFKTLKVNWVLN